ncbi:IS4 family transposase [Frankia sp. Ag45/Mut15]|uniref:IS4 family transposase n=1 Tax=Frankia umida TaxID=573489 RepID=A0ABT0K5Q6_9ACTN|nr:IS4 family transposase [Frankia umida]MCK9879134.1 IS4 family transposase [Frankia umida]
MGHDGSEGLSPEGWLPDRVTVGVLTRVYPPELVDRVLAVTDTAEVRRRLLPSRLVVYFVLALWLFRGRNCGYVQVLARLTSGLHFQRRAAALAAGEPGGAGWSLPASPSLGEARARIGSDPVRMLFEHAAGPVGVAGQTGVFLHGLRLVQIDGSTCDLPDTEKNRVFFAGPSNAGGPAPFPKVRWVIAAEAATGALLGASFGPWTTGEPALARDLLAHLGPGMLTLADRNFLSHRLASEVVATGAHLLWRAKANFTLAPVRVLDDGSYLAELTPARTRDGPPLTVRVIEYTVHSTTADGPTSSELFCLVTDLLDPEEWSMLDLACAYPTRWGCETVIGHHKTDLGEGRPVLRSKDPEGVAQEMWALFAVYQALARLIGVAADTTGTPPDKISFRRALAAASDSIGTAAFPP